MEQRSSGALFEKIANLSSVRAACAYSSPLRGTRKAFSCVEQDIQHHKSVHQKLHCCNS